MNRRTSISGAFLASALLVLATVELFGQTRPELVVPPKPMPGTPAVVEVPPRQLPASEMTPLTEVPARLERALATIRRITATQSDETELVREQLPDLTASLHGLIRWSRGIVFKSRSQSAIKHFREIWASALKQLDRSQTIVVNSNFALSESLAILERESRALDAAGRTLSERKVQTSINDTINRVGKQITQASEVAQARRTELLRVEAQLAELAIDVNVASDELNQLAATERGRLLEWNAQPIWRAPVKAVGDAPVLSHAEADGEEGFEGPALKYYARYLLLLSLEQALLYVLFLAPLLLIRRRALNWKHFENPAVNLLARVVQRPWSAAMLPVSIAASLFRGHLDLDSPLLLLPLLRIVPLVVPRQLKRGVWILATLFFADFALTSYAPATALSTRILQLINIAATGGALLWVQRHLRFAESSGSAAMLWRIGCRVSAVFVAGAFIGEVTGATAMSQYLEGGVLRSLFGAALLYSFLRICYGFLQLVLDPEIIPGGVAHILHPPPGAAGTLEKGMRWIAAVLFIMMTAGAFQLMDAFVEFARATAAQKISLGAIGFTFGSLFIIVATLTITVITSRVIRFFLDAAVYTRMDLQRGTSQVISKLLHYTMLSAAFLFSLSAAGVDLNRFTVLMGALGVGIGLGLQNIVGNFVSGLILLFERPLSVGDIVTVADVSGTVIDIGIRATHILTWDGADIAVPNSNLVSGALSNWKGLNELRGSELKVGVAYGTDPHRVMGILLESAAQHPLVLKDPKPLALFVGFGNSSLDFILRYWSPVRQYSGVNSEMYTNVCQRLASEGIEIPFPQRDLNLKATAGIMEIIRSAEGAANTAHKDISQPPPGEA